MNPVIIIPRGCTCRNSFKFPYAQEDVVTLFITYQQNKITKVENTLEDCSFVNDRVVVNLTQEQTLAFEENIPIKIQIRVKLKDGTASKSNTMEAYTDNVLKDGVI